MTQYGRLSAVKQYLRGLNWSMPDVRGLVRGYKLAIRRIAGTAATLGLRRKIGDPE